MFVAQAFSALLATGHAFRNSAEDAELAVKPKDKTIMLTIDKQGLDDLASRVDALADLTMAHGSGTGTFAVSKDIKVQYQDMQLLVTFCKVVWASCTLGAHQCGAKGLADFEDVTSDSPLATCVPKLYDSDAMVFGCWLLVVD